MSQTGVSILGTVLFSVGLSGVLAAYLSARAAPKTVPFWPVWAALAVAVCGLALLAFESSMVRRIARWLQSKVRWVKAYRSNRRWQLDPIRAFTGDGEPTIGLYLSPPPVLSRETIVSYGNRAATCRVSFGEAVYTSEPVGERMGQWALCFPQDFAPVLLWPPPAGRYTASWTVDALPESPAHRFTIDQYGRLS